MSNADTPVIELIYVIANWMGSKISPGVQHSSGTIFTGGGGEQLAAEFPVFH